MKLSELLANVSIIDSNFAHPSLNTEVKGICTNSHACQIGDLFLGMPGTRVDGGEFWSGALESGAIAAIISKKAAEKYPPTSDVCVIPVEDMVNTCAAIASAFYGHPSQTLTQIGITGTNGKTTTTHLVEFFLQQAQKKTALLGTLYARWPGYQETAVHTTPFAADLQKTLSEALTAGSEYAVMEVSSHALYQGRVKECCYEVGVFTNLTQDHLDFHETMENYFAAKALLFNEEYLKGRGVINWDDPYGKRLIESLGQEKAWSFSIEDSAADFYTDNLVYQANGVSGEIHTPQGVFPFQSPLVGQFNLSNLLAAVATIAHLGLDIGAVLGQLPEFKGVPGRMERVQVTDSQDISVIVDYAHTPDSLENSLKAARPFIKGQLICVFGCGGDRDRTKRPLMGKISAQLADLSVVTSDNPRTEEPDRIIEDILAGIPQETNLIVNSDRSTAIDQAIQTAKAGDGILIAGKGHEDYQILGTEKIHFDDREEAAKALAIRLQ
ncbi:MAG: UDP-N-acetylmuramoyl-L-alanyl-D-glutamate--2,6-diaminopimelate ligase [Microcystaceae cyanobacterium]